MCGGRSRLEVRNSRAQAFRKFQSRANSCPYRPPLPPGHWADAECVREEQMFAPRVPWRDEGRIVGARTLGIGDNPQAGVRMIAPGKIRTQWCAPINVR